MEASAGASGERGAGSTLCIIRGGYNINELHYPHQVLLKKLLDVFPFYLNFLDGDVLFRRLHALADVFVDDNRDLSVLTGQTSTSLPRDSVLTRGSLVGSTSRAVVKKKAYDYDSRGGIALPDPYNFRKRKRAAIVMFGYTAFKKGGNEYFEGHHTGGVSAVVQHHLLVTSISTSISPS